MASPTNTGRRPADTRKLLYDTPMVTIEVGAEKEHFVVHKSILCAKSSYFDRALSGSFQEAITRFFQLPDISPVLFRIFVAWLYYGDLGYVPRSGRTVEEDFRSLEITKENFQQKDAHQSKSQDGPSNNTENTRLEYTRSSKDVTESTSGIAMANSSESHKSSAEEAIDQPIPANQPTYEGEHPKGWPCDVPVRLYIFADRFDIRELRADSLDALNHATENDKSRICAFNVVRHIYLNTPSTSKLRKYVVHCASYEIDFGEDESEWISYPIEFLVAVMIMNGRRLPDKQCQECYGAALKYTLFAPQNDERNPKEDLPPYKTDLCFYHEHLNEEERKACRLRREGSKPAV
ncbi:hypothetical protein M436DRAFT_78351 [Aureobasidium namibiae CBS 147.97]|uniref:BTB domain-containing protein n=1 Tax=Aureobasidium namibiae CBS 147.97 TaxID=1043004 RepID=A0A074WTY7_9PEZI